MANLRPASHRAMHGAYRDDPSDGVYRYPTGRLAELAGDRHAVIPGSMPFRDGRPKGFDAGVAGPFIVDRGPGHQKLVVDPSTIDKNKLNNLTARYGIDGFSSVFEKLATGQIENTSIINIGGDGGMAKTSQLAAQVAPVEFPPAQAPAPAPVAAAWTPAPVQPQAAPAWMSAQPTPPQAPAQPVAPPPPMQYPLPMPDPRIQQLEGAMGQMQAAIGQMPNMFAQMLQQFAAQMAPPPPPAPVPPPIPQPVARVAPAPKAKAVVLRTAPAGAPAVDPDTLPPEPDEDLDEIETPPARVAPQPARVKKAFKTIPVILQMEHGDYRAHYHGVYVGESCLVLEFITTDTSSDQFSPKAAVDSKGVPRSSISIVLPGGLDGNSEEKRYNTVYFGMRFAIEDRDYVILTLTEEPEAEDEHG